MRKKPLIVLPVMLLLLILLAACQAESTPTGTPVGAPTGAPVGGPVGEPVAVSETSPASGEATAVDPTGTPAAITQASPAAAGADPTPEVVNECQTCHTDQQKLIDSANPDLQQMTAAAGLGGESDLPPMEPYQKVLVDGLFFPTTVHGLIGCVGCHGGQQSAEKDAAHAGLVVNPSVDAGGVCSQCHPHITAAAKTSLHNNLTGYTTLLERRGASPHSVEEILNTSCTACHTSCADCHISQPGVVGGGLIAGHNFEAQPSMERNCTACHSAQVGAEFLGKHRGLEADVHYRQGGLECTACHSGDNMHGQPENCTACHPGPESAQLPPPSHRYAGVQEPSCESCHVSAATKQDDVMMHKLHGSKLACQVCHAVEYANWDGASFAENANGDAQLQSEMTLAFLIGRNPLQTNARPYEYVTVRHAPISTTTFDYFEENLLAAFSRVETWQYATPHNIQRITPQNQSCNYCHGNTEIFLTADKVAPEELEANRNVIVEQIPPLITSAEQIPDVFGP